MNKALDVYFKKFFVGQLIQDEHGQLFFSYDIGWLNQHHAVPLSCSLPLRKEAFKKNECRGFFSGLLPEESSREILAGILGISARNDYSMLEKIGGECAGAITFLPAGIELIDSDYNYQALDGTALFELLGLLPKAPLLVGKADLRLSLAGAQSKIAVYLDEKKEIFLPLRNAASSHIIKPASRNFPNTVSNEALCLELAKSIGIPAANAERVIVNGLEYLLVERYDRAIGDHGKYPIRLHQEDFCQALGVVPECKYQQEGGPGLKKCFDLLREESSFPAIDLQNLLNLVIFNIIVGNHDAHGKNFSLLFDAKGGKIRFAPAYDILSTVYYPGLTSKMAMKLGKEYESSNLTLKNIEKFATDAGLGFASVCKQSIEVAERVKKNLVILKEKYKEVENLLELIDNRATRFMQLFK